MKRESTGRLRPRHSILAAAIACGLGIFQPEAVFANADPTGQLRGQLLGAEQAQYDEVLIELTHASQGFVRTAKVAADGSYVLKSLPVGVYHVTLKAPGRESRKLDDVEVKLGSATQLDIEVSATAGADIERMEVLGSRISRIDHADTSSGLVMSSRELQKLPVAQNITAVSLLAPGAIQADGDFGNLASFSGASGAENAYYLNGLNITDVRKGMGWVAFPWEAVNQTEVITGGVGAQYGRFIGGVTNLVSKSGDNEFHATARAYYEPDSLREDAPDLNAVGIDGVYQRHVNNSGDERDKRTYTLAASGPIVQDKAFFYVAYEPETDKDGWGSPGATPVTTRRSRERDRLFTNLDWYVLENHAINVLYAKEDEDTARHDSSAPGSFGGDQQSEFFAASYRGQLTDDLSLTVTRGRTTVESEFGGGTPNLAPSWDSRSGSDVRVGSWAGQSEDLNLDRRDMLRVDFSWTLGDHTLNFGYDQDEQNSRRDLVPHGAQRSYINYYRNGSRVTTIRDRHGNVVVIPASADYIRAREFTVEADIDSESRAFYVEDQWQLSDTLMLNLGLRNDEFANYTASGDKYTDMQEQWAPRLGLSWDVLGDGNHKFQANLGRYYQPIAQNTGVRMTAHEVDIRRYYLLGAAVGDGTYQQGDSLGIRVVNDGQIAEGYKYADVDLKPMYEDEALLGYSMAVGDDWMLGVNLRFRKLQSSIEDGVMDYAVEAWCESTQRDCSGFGGFPGGGFVLRNPGEDFHGRWDLDGDGALEDFTVPAAFLGYPEAKRSYKAVELLVEGRPTEALELKASYVWSKSYGNTEGLLNSDNDQADPGWTRSFDSPELTDHATGYLPNDRRHAFKLWGNYALADDWGLGFVYSAFSGRPVNAFGYHPLDAGACAGVRQGHCDDALDNLNFYHDGRPAPRGSGGRTPWVHALDLSAYYDLDLGEAGRLNLNLAVYNLFNFDHATQLNEYAEAQNQGNPLYKTPTSWQTPRYVALTARYDF
ncbi:MAG: TonB-dependent receptor [Gammaproteobacteria bacterium]|nr:TonB-dependent receptor [Gammaproteobacteria bacterium]